MKCPKCKKEISKLIALSDGKLIQNFIVNVDYPEYSDIERDFIDTEYRCPECGEMLFRNDEEKAINFLMGKKK